MPFWIPLIVGGLITVLGIDFLASGTDSIVGDIGGTCIGIIALLVIIFGFAALLLGHAFLGALFVLIGVIIGGGYFILYAAAVLPAVASYHESKRFNKVYRITHRRLRKCLEK